MHVISLYQPNFKNLLSLRIIRNCTSKFLMEIQTYIFIDSETTGLPFQEYNKTKITELCFTIVQSEHIKLGVFPRVQNKLNLCFNPCKLISPEATKLTGLSNDLLEYQPRFQLESFNLINDFLNLQKKPVCLVAHNGNCFDYPILRAEIDKTGSALSDDVLCIDSLQAFRDLHSINNNEQKACDLDLAGQMNEGLDIHDAPTQKCPPPEFSDGYDELIFNLVEEFENSPQKENVKNVQLTNETTPNKRSKLDSTDYCNALTSNDCETINNSYYMASSSTTLMSRKILAHTSNNSTINSNFAPDSKSKAYENSLVSSKRSLNFRRPSFKLCDVYTRLTNKDPTNSHRAEHDVAMLIECAATLGQHFTDWANMNAKKFSDIPMMKPGRRLGT